MASKHSYSCILLVFLFSLFTCEITCAPLSPRNNAIAQVNGKRQFPGPFGGSPFGGSPFGPRPPTFNTLTPSPPPAPTTNTPPPATATPPPPALTSSFVQTTLVTSITSLGTFTTTSFTTTVPAASATSPSNPPPVGSSGQLQLSFINNLGSSNAHVYITGLDSNGKVVLLQTDGTFYYPASPGTTTPQPITADIAIPLAGPGQSTQITIPGYISSSRVWFADGTLDFSVVDTQFGPGLVQPTPVNPADASATVNWGFIELTYNQSLGLFANLSFVDFVGLPLGIQLQTISTGTQTVAGMPGDGVNQICNLLKAQASKDGQPWDQLCVYNSDGSLLRVDSPATMMAATKSSSFGDYFTDYVNQIWTMYADSPLTINTQAAPGEVTCTTSGGQMNCDGDNRPYPMPSAADIFGCNTGPFTVLESDNDVHRAVVPRLCAAFNRATLHLQGGNVQPSLPPQNYYTILPNNYYSAIVHQVEAEGKGYAFSYDDVSPSQDFNTAGAVSAPDPQLLTVYVGGAAAT